MSYKLYFDVQLLKKSLSQVSPDALSRNIDLLIQKHKKVELSPKASVAFYRDLQSILTSYIQMNFPDTGKSGLGKLLEKVPLEKKQLQTLLKSINDKLEESIAAEKEAWKLPLYLRVVASLTDSTIDPINFYKNKDLRKATGNPTNPEEDRATLKLKLIGHNLMSQTSLNNEMLSGNHLNLVNYKVLSALNKFYKKYHNALMPDFKMQLQNAYTQLKNLLSLFGYVDLNELCRDSTPGLMPQRHADLSCIIRSQLLTLGVGKKMPIPSGYRRINGGHAAIAEIARTSEHEYSLSLLETGGFAEMYLCNPKTKPVKSTLFIVPRLELADFFNTPLLDDVVRAEFFYTKDPSHAPLSMLKPFLIFNKEGRLQRGKQEFPLQVDKICTRAAIFAWLQLNLDPLLFNCFEHFVIGRDIEKADRLKKNPDSSMRTILSKLKISYEEQDYYGYGAVSFLQELGKKELAAKENILKANIDTIDRDIKAKIQITPESTASLITLFGISSSEKKDSVPSSGVYEALAAHEQKISAIKNIMGWKNPR